MSLRCVAFHALARVARIALLPLLLMLSMADAQAMRLGGDEQLLAATSDFDGVGRGDKPEAPSKVTK